MVKVKPLMSIVMTFPLFKVSKYPPAGELSFYATYCSTYAKYSVDVYRGLLQRVTKLRKVIREELSSFKYFYLTFFKKYPHSMWERSSIKKLAINPKVQQIDIFYTRVFKEC